MERDYLKDWSGALERDMEVLRFGRAGVPVLALPTSQGRFYQWEDFGLVGAVADRIDAGQLQVWCVDSVDGESWYAKDRHPRQRLERHLQYERYLVDELMPRIAERPIAAGPSFGALHAVLLAVRHPTRVRGFVGLSGAYDTARWLDGYSDEDAYLTNLLAFLPGLDDQAYLGPLQAMNPRVIATGEEDANVADSIKVARLLRERGVSVQLDLWPGWAHDWPYWQDMLRRYISQ